MKRSMDPLCKPSPSKVANLKIEEYDNYDAEKLDLLLDKVSNIEETLTTVVDLLTQLTEHLAPTGNNATTLQINMGAHAEVLLPRTPYTKTSEFLAFEENLNEVNRHEILARDFCNVVARDSREFVGKCWRRVFTDNVAKNFCWQGTNEKGCISSLRTTAAIRDAFKLTYPIDRVEIFEQRTKKFFQYASDRLLKYNRYRESRMGKNRAEYLEYDSS